MEDKYQYHTIIPKSDNDIAKGLEELSWKLKEMFLFKHFMKRR
jgi:hypothetical protein